MNLDALDLSQIDKANESIDRLIEQRAAEREREEMWKQSEARYNAQRERERWREWAEFYRIQIRAAESARARAEERLLRLIDQGAG
jgi:hypothetical protein